jgi:hypothetical protein
MPTLHNVAINCQRFPQEALCFKELIALGSNNSEHVKSIKIVRMNGQGLSIKAFSIAKLTLLVQRQRFIHQRGCRSCFIGTHKQTSLEKPA